MVVLVGNWWTFVLRGIAAVLFGILTFLFPGMALLTLVYVFGFYALADGVLSIIAAFRRSESARNETPWWALLLSGIFGLIAGLIAIFRPGITAIALLFLIAAWAIVTGVMEIVAAIRLRKQIRGEWLLALAGVMSILFGVLAAIFPGAGALAVVLWIGAYTFVMGIVLIALGLRLRSFVRRVTDEVAHAAGIDHGGGLAHGH
jgi:uncharacterized membrane protein HdeD (DUF308 family)